FFENDAKGRVIGHGVLLSAYSYRREEPIAAVCVNGDLLPGGRDSTVFECVHGRLSIPEKTLSPRPARPPGKRDRKKPFLSATRIADDPGQRTYHHPTSRVYQKTEF